MSGQRKEKPNRLISCVFAHGRFIDGKSKPWAFRNGEKPVCRRQPPVEITPQMREALLAWMLLRARRGLGAGDKMRMGGRQ